MLDYFSLALGYLSVAFHIAQFVSQTTKKMLIYGLASTALLGLHFLLSGTSLGFYAVVLSIVVKITALMDFKTVSKVTLVATPILGFIYYASFSEPDETFLPALAMVFIATADFQKDIVKMKAWYYGSAFSWLCYGIYISSVPAVAYDVLGIGFLTYGIYRALSDRKKQALYTLPSNS